MTTTLLDKEKQEILKKIEQKKKIELEEFEEKKKKLLQERKEQEKERRKKRRFEKELKKTEKTHQTESPEDNTVEGAEYSSNLENRNTHRRSRIGSEKNFLVWTRR